MNSTNGVLQIFSREPVPGKTKTRLIPILGKQGTVDLHKEMLKHIIEVACASQFNEIELWGTSNPDKSILQDYVKQYHLRLFKQSGNNVGERMSHSSKEALSQYDFVVIIGCDCPCLSSQILDEAYMTLAKGCDAVIGPAEDGGYYLIGSRRNDDSIFMGIPWGEASVADTTRAKLKTLDWQWEELECLWDVDRPTDYERLKQLDNFYSSAG